MARQLRMAWPKGRVGVLIGAAVLALTLSSCSAGGGLEAAQAGSAGTQEFVSGDLRVHEILPADRREPVRFAGVTERGDAVSSNDYVDQVLVVNFWYAACGPCIVEAPRLEEVWQTYQGNDVAFLGVNIYDQPSTAESFAADNGVSYPSVIDIVDKSVSQAFAAVTPIQATPTTLVLDRQGRVAARIIGELQSASILSALVADALEETT